MKRLLLAAVAFAALALAPAAADARGGMGGHGGGFHGGGFHGGGWRGPALGLGLGLGAVGAYNGYYGGSYYSPRRCWIDDWGVRRCRTNY